MKGKWNVKNVQGKFPTQAESKNGGGYEKRLYGFGPRERCARQVLAVVGGKRAPTADPLGNQGEQYCCWFLLPLQT